MVRLLPKVWIIFIFNVFESLLFSPMLHLCDQNTVKTTNKCFSSCCFLFQILAFQWQTCTSETLYCYMSVAIHIGQAKHIQSLSFSISVLVNVLHKAIYTASERANYSVISISWSLLDVNRTEWANIIILKYIYMMTTWAEDLFVSLLEFMLNMCGFWWNATYKYFLFCTVFYISIRYCVKIFSNTISSHI